VLGASETNPTLTRSGAITPGGQVIIVLQKEASDGDWDVAKIANAVEQAMGSTAMSHNLTTTGAIVDDDLIFALTGVADDSATFTRASTAISGGPSWDGNVVEYPATHASSTTGNDMAADLIYRKAGANAASGQTITVTATLSAAERVASVLFRVRAPLKILPSAIASAEAFGTATVTAAGPLVIAPISIPPPVSDLVYGNGVVFDSLANTRTDDSPSHSFFRFRAPRSGTITGIRFYYVSADSGSGYGGGTGGTMRITIETDDGTSDHFPSGTALATEDLAAVAVGDADRFVTIDPGAEVTKGQIYHVVFENTDASPATNYFSVDNAYVFDDNPPHHPRFADDIWAHGMGMPWERRNRYIPILDITFEDGTHYGQGYFEGSYDAGEMAQITGSNYMARERFTVTDGPIDIVSVGIAALRESGTDDLSVRLEDDSGNEIKTVTMPYGSFVVGGWTSNPTGLYVIVPMTAHLVNGTYRLRLSTASGSVYWAFATRRGSDSYGYDPVTTFPDANPGAQKTTNGSTWTSLGGVTDENDLQFCFITAGGVGTPELVLSEPLTIIAPSAINSAETFGTTRLGQVVAPFSVAAPHAGNSYLTTVLGKSPRLHYEFEEARGVSVAEDSTANNRDGTYFTGVTPKQTSIVPSKPDSFSANFNGTAGSVGIPDGAIATGNNPWSVVCAFQAESSVSGRRDLFGLGSYVSGQAVSGGIETSGVIRIRPYGGTYYTFGSVNWKDGNPHHAVFIYDGTYFRVFVDGVQQGSDTDPTETINIVEDQSFVGVWDFRWDGLIDAFSYFNSAISATDVEELYRAWLGGSSFGTANVQITTPTTIIAPSAINSAEAFGTPTILRGNVNILPSAIASAQTFGTAVIVRGGVIIIPTGITSQQNFGTPIVSSLAKILPSAIGSGEAVGTPIIVRGVARVLPSSIGSAEVFGSHTLRATAIIIVSGIASGEEFGDPTVTLPAAGLTILPSAITSAEAFGTPVILRGNVNIVVNAISSAEVFGSHVLRATATIIVSGISTTEGFGTPLILRGNVNIVVSSIGSAQAFGTPILRTTATIIVTSITSGEAFGVPVIIRGPVVIVVGGIASGEALGLPRILLGGGLVLPSPVGSGEIFGTPTILRGSVTIVVTAITSAEGFGQATLTPTAKVIVSGIGTQAVVPNPHLYSYNEVRPTAITTDELFGLPVVAVGPAFVRPTSIDPLEIFGLAKLVGTMENWHWLNYSSGFAGTRGDEFPSTQSGLADAVRDDFVGTQSGLADTSRQEGE
jgi:hypothetical protein